MRFKEEEQHCGFLEKYLACLSVMKKGPQPLPFHKIQSKIKHEAAYTINIRSLDSQMRFSWAAPKYVMHACIIMHVNVQ